MRKAFVAAGVALLAGLLPWLPSVQDAEMASLDARFRIRGPRRSNNGKVVVIAIDDATERAWTDPQAFWGSNLADVIAAVSDAGPSRILVDYIQAADADAYIRSKGGQASPNADLSAALTQASEHIPVILGVASTVDLTKQPLAGLVAAVHGKVGSIATGYDTRTTIRHLPFIDDGFNPALPSLAASIGGTDHPDFHGTYWINYSGQPPTVISARDAQAGKGLDAVAGAIVLIGETHRFSEDKHGTPYDSLVPGVYIQGEAVRTLLDHRRLNVPSPLTQSVIAGLIGGLATLLAGLASVKRFMFAVIVATIGWLAMAQVSFAAWDEVLPVASPLIAWLVLAPLAVYPARAVQERLGRERIKARFGAMISDRFVELLETNPQLGPGEIKTITGTLMVLDIAGFSDKSNRLPPKVVLDAINLILAACMKELDARDGLVLQFTGDGFSALFGFDGDGEAAAKAGTEASAGIIASIAALHREGMFGEESWPIRIGLAKGEVSLSIAGSIARHSLTVYGPAFNLASRLEKAGKSFDAALVADASLATELANTELTIKQDSMSIDGWEGEVQIVFAPQTLH